MAFARPRGTDVRLSGLIAGPYARVHRDVRAMRHAEYWFLGGRGSGKSSFVALEIALGLLSDPEANAIAYRKVGATLRESVFEQMLWAIAALGVSDRFARRMQPLELEYRPTGQRMLFRGADSPEKSKSIALAKGRFKYLWFEELGEFSGMEDVRTIKASVLRGGKSLVFASCNPPVSPSDWVNLEALRCVPGRFLHRSTYLDLPGEWLGEAFLREAELLRAEDMRAYRHMYLGEAVGYGAQVFENLSIRPIPDAEIEGLEHCLCGLDFGFANDPDAFVRLSYSPARRKLTFAGEFVRARMPVEALAEELRSRVEPGERVVCDSAEPRAMAALRALGVPCEAAKKGPGSVHRGMRFLQGLAEIAIDPVRCPVAAREFSRCAYARDREGRITGAYEDGDNHVIDAARYAVERFVGGREARTFSREGIGI
ncbi:MAG: PBSX family phage terminase large subunit [Clostridiales bacterium]|jgi:phage terminase large subunit|nr:PBSX family phage terminase large subunit [Clostridiales bacterium]